MILIADIGNSHCRFAVFNNDTLIKKYDDIKKIDFTVIEKAVLISVNEKPLLEICQYLENLQIPYEIMGKPEYHLPCTDKKLLQNLGTDRAANILGGLHFNKAKTAFIAIDCGTAITIDYCNEAGLFCGGVILSGQQLMAQALHDYTDKLPLVSFEQIKKPENIIGTNTMEAINNGLTYGMADMIDGIVNRMIRLTATPPKLYLCGGNGDNYAELSSHDLILQKDLTLWGGLCYSKK